MDPLIREAERLISPAGVRWAVCGGFALDMFLGRETRRHSDIDICVFEEDRAALCAHMWKHRWSVYEMEGNGILRSLYPGSPPSLPGRNLMCTKGDCMLLELCPMDDGDPDSDLYGYRFDYRGIYQLDYMELLFDRAQGGDFVFDPRQEVRRELSKAILYREGVPYLAPELVLLYKARRPEHHAFREDWDNTEPYLSPGQREWLRGALRVCGIEGPGLTDSF